MPEDNSDNKNSVNEPNLNYDKQIHVFHSFEEAELHQLKLVINQKPVDRVKEVVQLILRIYKINHAVKEINSDRDIIIDKG